MEKEVLLEETFFRNVLVWGEYEYFCERNIHKTQLGLIYLHLYIFLKGLGEYANATCTGVRCPQPRSQPLAPIRSHFVCWLLLAHRELLVSESMLSEDMF